VGLQHSEETRKKISERTKLAVRKIKVAKLANLGLTEGEYEAVKEIFKKQRIEFKRTGGITEEGRRKISESVKARWQDETFRSNFSAKMKGIRRNRKEARKDVSDSKPLLRGEGDENSTKETALQSTDLRHRNSELLKARWKTPEFRARMTKGDRSPGWREAISKAIREKWTDPVYRDTMCKERASRKYRKVNHADSSYFVSRRPRTRSVRLTEGTQREEEAKLLRLAKKQERKVRRCEAISMILLLLFLWS